MPNTSTISTEFEHSENEIEYYHIYGNIYQNLFKMTNSYNFLIACLGLITNSATIVLLLKSFVTKNLRHKWTLIALALSDLILNISLLIQILHDVSHRKIQYLCITTSFLSVLAELLSAYFTVFFTIQRYAAVRYPFQAALQTRSSPVISLGFIFLVSIVFCTVLSYKNKYVNCQEELQLSWFIVDAIFSFIIPFSLILIFNILIVNLIQEQGRSPITVQSTLTRSGKNREHHDNKKSNPQEESYSTTHSCGYSVTSNRGISETDIDDKANQINPLVKYEGRSITLKKKLSILSCHSSEETDFLGNETGIPMSPIEHVNSDVILSDNQPQAARLPTKASRESKTKKRTTSSNSYEQRELVCLSNDVDSISAKEGQTTQSIRVTRMLVLVSTCFLILNAPAHICLIAAKITSGNSSDVIWNHTVLHHFQSVNNLTENQSKTYVFIPADNDRMSEKKMTSSHDTEPIDDRVALHLFYIAALLMRSISYTSYSINFFLYSYSGVAFRTSLRQFFTKLWKH